VADASHRRDARKRAAPEPVGATVSDAVDRIWTPDKADKPKRAN
jgi:hypothetical protein